MTKERKEHTTDLVGITLQALNDTSVRFKTSLPQFVQIINHIKAILQSKAQLRKTLVKGVLFSSCLMTVPNIHAISI